MYASALLFILNLGFRHNKPVDAKSAQRLSIGHPAGFPQLLQAIHCHRMRALLLLFPMTLAAQADLNPQFVYNGPTSGEIAGKAEVVPVTGMPFASAWRLTTLWLPATADNNTEYAIRIRARIALAVQKSDLVVAAFQMRCVTPAGGECATRLNVERAVSPYTKSYSQPLLSTAAWHAERIAFRMAESYAPNEFFVDFWMGQQVQTVEIGDISLLNYGPNVQPADLGIDTLYDGAAADAPWRAAAAERIEKFRKADLAVMVQDADGNPISGATVEVRMQRHAYGFGTAVAGDQLLGADANTQRYRQFILDNFNMVVLENDLKWQGWEANPQRALNA